MSAARLAQFGPDRKRFGPPRLGLDAVPQYCCAVSETNLHRSRIVRIVYGTLGFVSLAVGVIGIGVPGLPTVVFVLLAAYFFSMSSERMYTWLMEHRVFGPFIRDYRAGLGIRRMTKVYAIVMIAVSFSITIFLFSKPLWLNLLLVATALSVSVYIVTRPTTEVVLAERAAQSA